MKKWLEEERERKREEARRAELARQQATIDYNVMMGNLEDPEEDEGDE